VPHRRNSEPAEDPSFIHNATMVAGSEKGVVAGVVAVAVAVPPHLYNPCLSLLCPLPGLWCPQVEFHALRFVEFSRRVAQSLVDRISAGGQRPYVALHLRLERDVWGAHGVLPGAGAGPGCTGAEREGAEARSSSRASDLTAAARRQAGLCPMTAGMVAR